MIDKPKLRSILPIRALLRSPGKCPDYSKLTFGVRGRHGPAVDTGLPVIWNSRTAVYPLVEREQITYTIRVEQLYVTVAEQLGTTVPLW